MLFNSLQFILFFIIVFALYLCLNHRWQNRMLLVASCIFYGAWDWRFLFLIFASISVDYFCALKIHYSDSDKRRKQFLFISIFVNLAILGFFKYFNFFTNNLQILLDRFWPYIHMPFLNIILPLGISFYTFEAMSYVIDVYRKKMEPTANYVNYALFVTYFPHLIAGPIMRAKDLLPQIISPRKISLDNFYEGCYLIFWGLFQKIFVADNLAKIVNPIFSSTGPYDGFTVLIGVYAFSFQIFCDFAGYSNIARGLGKCMGFDIMINFNLPYFATNPREFWQRWHISLSSWLRDYLYIPLGGNRKGELAGFRNVAVTFLLGGLWHGANWTFVVWGAYHGFLIIVYRLFTPLLKKFSLIRNEYLKFFWTCIKTLFFFHLVCFGWLIFRAQSINQVFAMLKALLFNFKIAAHLTPAYPKYGFSEIIFFVWIVIVVQMFQFQKSDLMVIFKSNRWLKVIFYFTCFYLILIFGVNGAKEFIYFQF